MILRGALSFWLLALVVVHAEDIGNTALDDSSGFDDREILLSIFQSTGGFSWTESTNWLQQGVDECEWKGVTCYPETYADARRVGRIQALNLKNNHLKGTVPTSVFSIPYLETLNLEDNGDVTVDFSGLSNAQFLKELDLSNTQVANVDSLGNAPNLETLHLTGLGLKGSLPSSLLKLTNLVYFYANDNSFSGSLPSEIGNMKALRELYLGNSDLTGQLPDALGSLTLLEALVLTNNAFGGTMPQTAMDALSNLNILAIQRDGDLPKGTGISGSVPAFAKHPNLVSLYLQNQMLSGTLNEYFLNDCNEGEEVEVDLSNNQISGSIPETLVDKKYLKLYLADNQITSVSSTLISGSSCPSITGWMDGDVGTLGCDAFLCPPGTWAPEGRATAAAACNSCSDNASLWGRTECASSTSPDVHDREVLVNLYNVMGGRDWKNDNNWLNLDASVCDWYGISCTSAGLVSAINLRNNGLSGTAPDELFTLSELQILDFELNKITFSFKGISAASKLQELNLASTGLPASALSDIQELTSLNSLAIFSIDSNSLGGNIPSDIFSLTGLQELRLGQNGFTGTLDTRIGQLTQLQHLSIDGNELTGQFPTQIGNLVSLQELASGENRFGGTLPTELEKLTNLLSLSLQQVVAVGGIGGPMLPFSNLAQLTSLELGSNALTGTLPAALLSNSRNLGSAITVDLSENILTGSVPSQWSRFDKLFVDLSGNRISGIDSSLCQISDWMGGDVGSYGCDGILCPKGTANSAGRKSDDSSPCTKCSNGGTDFFGAKSCSAQVTTFGNDGSVAGILSDFFSATLGSAWKQKTGWDDSADVCSFYGIECDGSGNVLKIDLTDNGLQGTVPGSIFKLKGLNALILSKNTLAVEFDGIQNAADLTVLELEDVNLDSIEGLGGAPNLATVNLADNNLQGEIPYELYLLSDLRELNLGYNQLSGRVPNLVGALTGLEILRLYHNKFVGKLPAALGDLSNLKELNLAENNFEGTIPPELNELTNLRFLSLQREGGILGTDDIGISHGDSSALGTGLTGTLPAFEKLTVISELYLGLNSLSGSIPPNFLDGVTDLSTEVKVDLISNQLTGTIPGSLTEFQKMSLYVADNQITGIAGDLCKMSNWLGGDVGQYQCDGLLCPVDTYNALGRKGPNASTCQTCSTGTNGYMGSVDCLTGVEQALNSERAVLEKIFKQMNGENWLESTNWLDADESICTWYGIECVSDDNPSVETIDLQNNRLLGFLVADIFNLPNLKKLILKQNDITVSLFGIQNAVSLQYLDLSETGLTSLSGISLAPSLRVIRADGNAMTEFPSDIYSMSNLETLSLSDNPFPQMVVPDLQGLPNLKILSLGNAGLKGIIPEWVGYLSSLEYLKLSQNGLMGYLPVALLNLMNLKYLDLSDQESNEGGLMGNLLDFANQTQLSEIYLQHNMFTGTIPPTMLQSNSNTGLVTLDLRYNMLTGEIPSELSRITQMNLYLASNMFNSLPTELCNNNWNNGNTGKYGCDGILCAPGTFNSYGRATGNLACMTCDSPFMTSVLGSTTCGASLEHTALINFYQSTGGPSWKSDNNWLKTEDHCTWEGITCHADGDFEGLVQKIELEDNNLVGIAEVVLIWRFEGLELLNLQKNPIVVSFINIENAINLETIIISETNTSSLMAIGGAMNLKELHVTSSQLFGQLPDELFNLTLLEKLYLSQNYLTGTLPSLIGQLTNLEEFYIFDNDVRGTLPSELGRLGKLKHLSLGNNEFVGAIPRQVGSLPRLEVLSIEKEEDPVPTGMFSTGGSPGLTGSLPALNGLPNIKELYLGHNAFTGTIPGDFLQGVTNKSALLIVDLSYNNLVGPIPSSFANFGNLRIELGRNQITEIPDEVCAKKLWFNGEVANGCDAILCFPGTFNEYGRRVDAKTICENCTYPGSALDYGSVECGPVMADAMDDRSILMELYDAAGGSEWANSDGWNSETVNFCDWYGITCEPEGDFGQMAVTEVALMENNLHGAIPSILFHLPELRKLDVRNNDVTIGLNALFQAEHIEELYLDKTRVTDLEGVGRATSLRVLHLHHNSFGWKPIPDELFDLTALEDLILSDSMFGGTLSTKIGQLTSIKRLSLVGNAISGQIPAEIGNLVAVEDLDLSSNDWRGTLPDTVNSLTALKSLGLTNSQIDRVGLTGQLKSFATMPSLRELYLSNNQFTGTIPYDFLGGVGDKSALITVYLDGNNLGGTVPDSLTAFSQVNIYLENNLLTGFGSGICELSQWMDGNVGKYGCDALLCPAGEYSPAGRQTSETTACSSCPDLQGSPILGSNFCLSIQKSTERGILEKLFGATGGTGWKNKDGWTDSAFDICSWYGVKCKQGSSVESILLGSNGLIGTIPTEIYQLPNLKFLWLYSNAVDIGFEGIAQATNLRSLILDSTKIRSLDGIGQGISLVDVDVRFNNLGGPIPTELNQLYNMQSFTCSENDFTGKVPELPELRKLTTLRMSSNQLTGTLPSFSQHPSLVSLDISQNKLVGPIPPTILGSVAESEKVFLDLSGNRLTGTVPGELSRFADLTIFLRGNRIEGINPNLCEQTKWNGGDVGAFKCDGILCPSGTFSPTGRESITGPTCQSCSKNKYFGSTTCGSSASRLSGALGFLASVAIATTGLLLWA